MKIDEKKLYIQCAKKGWNFSNLAEAIGVSKVTLYGYRKRNIRPNTLNRITKALDCDPEELLE